MSDFVDADGKPIPEEQLADAVASGGANVREGERVHMLDAAGRPVTVPSDQVGAAIGAGFQPESSQSVEARHTAKEYGTIVQKAITAVEGAGRGLTFGLSDVAASEIGGDDYRKAALARQQTNPLTAGGGELVGALAPLLLSGGGSAAATGAKAGFFGRALTAVPRGAEAAAKALLPFANETTVAGRMALRAAQSGVAGALEGALYGAGTTAGGIELRGDQITAEKVLSGAGQGALLGGLLGTVGGGLAAKLEARGAAKAATREGEDLLMREKVSRLEESLRKQGMSDEKIAATVARQTEKSAARASKLDGIASRAALHDLNISPGMLKSRASVAEVDDLLARAGKDYLDYTIQTGPLAGKRIFHGIRNPVDVLDDIAHAHAETGAQIERLEQVASDVARQSPELAPDMAPALRKLDEAVAASGDPALGKALLQKYGEPLRGALAADPLGALRGLSEGIGGEVAKLSPTKGAPMRAVKEAVDDALNDAVEKTLTKAGIDPRTLRTIQRQHESLGLVKEAVEQMKFAQAASGKKLDSNALGYALIGALTGNFATAAGGAAAALGKAWLKQRAGGIVGELAHRVAKADMRVSFGAKALAGDAVGIAARVATPRPITGSAARHVYQAIQEANASDESRAQYVARITERYAAQYPELAMQAQQVATGDLQYLAAHLPVSEGRAGSTLTPMAIKSFGTNRAAEREFWERFRALDDPGFVVDELMAGKVPTAAIETLKVRRPLLWSDLRDKVIEETAARSSELPFKRRITLGLAFDFASDKSLSPGMLENIQKSIAIGTMPPAQPARPNTQVTQAALDSSAEAFELPNQKLEM